MRIKVLLVASLLASALSLPALGQIPPPPDPLIGHWPDMMLSVGAVYSPAPLAIDRTTGAREKLLDQSGFALSGMWRLAGYLLLGFQADCLFAANTRSLQVGPRVAGLLPLGEDVALYAALDGGVVDLATGKPDHLSRWYRSYTGFQGRAGLGALVRLSPKSTFFVELSGTAARLTALEQIFYSCIAGNPCPVDPFDRPNLYRLQITIGGSLSFLEVRRSEVDEPWVGGTDE